MCLHQHQFAVSADIEGMFLHVGVPPSHQPSLPFLWSEDAISDVEVLQYTRHTFGARNSPTSANFAIQQTAMDNVEKFPKASKVVTIRFYMDGYLDCFGNHDDAMRISKDLVSLLKLEGFRHTKFVSNVPAIEENLSPSPNVTAKVMDIASGSDHLNSHMLGLKWNFQSLFTQFLTMLVSKY